MVTNWNMGRRILEQEQKGKNRAAYGDRLIELISEDLTRKFGEGYGKRNVQYFRKFYLLFNDFEIVNTCVRNLNWSHFKRLLPDAVLLYPPHHFFFAFFIDFRKIYLIESFGV